ncbi:MAG: LAGLIDADG family homing endonuclease [Smithella sp.]
MDELKLSDDQLAIVDAVRSGENILITGSAGCGKSFLVHHLIDTFKIRDVTASTGIAALNINGVTIHSWAGIGIGTDDSQTIINKIRFSSFMEKTRKSILACKILIIDEISMLSDRMLTLIDLVLRGVRDNRDEAFGGIQVIAVGDFMQLPPVSKETRELFAFEGNTWKIARFQTYCLTKVFRQADQRFSQCLNNLRVGKVTQSDIDLLMSRNGKAPSPEDPYPICLYATNQEADMRNTQKLNELKGELFLYEYKDTETDSLSQKQIELFSSKLDKDCLAPKLLQLKVNARVMLLKNISFPMGLVNGSMGTVSKLTADGAWVLFDNGKDYFLSPADWEIRDNGVIKYKRSQVPLRLAYGITTHKCVSENSVLEVLGKGFIQIKDVAVGDFVNTGKGNFKKILNKWNSGIKKSFKLTTQNGYSVECSEDHKFLVNDTQKDIFKKLKNISLADYMIIDPKVKSEKTLNTIDLDLCWLLGALVGDGSYNGSLLKDKYRIDFTNMDVYVLRKYFSVLRKYQIKFNARKSKSRAIQCYSYGRKFREFLVSLGLNYQKREFKTVPNTIMGGTIDEKASFLRGLFDTDGYASKDRNSIVINAVGLNLLSQVQVLLLHFGIFSRIKSSKVKGKEYYWLYISNHKNIDLFCKHIGFTVDYKEAQSKSTYKSITRYTEIPHYKYIAKAIGSNDPIMKESKLIKSSLTYDAFLKLNNSLISQNSVIPDSLSNLLKNQYIYEKIESIEESGNAIMYDIEVEDDHSFWCNGFVAHNCQGMTLDSVYCDLTRVFESGQAYVALSRAKSIERLYLNGFHPGVIRANESAVAFYEGIA